MPADWEGLGMATAGNAASGIVGAGLGLLLEGHNDRRQLRQQEKLQQLEMSGQRAMTDYNMQKQLEMWKATNYSAQMEQMKLAGLNPALMYGMGGGGGVTSNVETGKVTGGHAPGGGGEAMGMGIQMMNMQLMKAQKENIEADTENKKATTTKTAVDTDKSKVEISSIMTGIDNAKIQGQILKWEEQIRAIDANIADQTSQDKMGQIVSLAETAASTAEMIERDNQIAGETKQSKINEIKARSIGAVIQNEATASSIMQKWAELKLKEGEVNIKAFEAQLKAEYPGVFNVIGGAMNGVIRILSGNKGFNSSENPIK